jgi:hypothetical protein
LTRREDAAKALLAASSDRSTTMKAVQQILTAVIMFCVLFMALTIGKCSSDVRHEFLDNQLTEER